MPFLTYPYVFDNFQAFAKTCKRVVQAGTSQGQPQIIFPATQLQRQARRQELKMILHKLQPELDCHVLFHFAF